jgi:hypothetical protein
VAGRVDSLDPLDRQEMISLIHRLHHVDNVMKSEVEIYSSQYEYEQAEIYVSSDGSKVFDLMYYEEAECEDNNESYCSSQEGDNASKYSSSREYDANWEEERNDGSCHSCASRDMNSFSKFERQNAS